MEKRIETFDLNVASIPTKSKAQVVKKDPVQALVEEVWSLGLRS